MRKKSKKRNKMIGVALVIIVLLFGIITVKFIQYEKIIEDTEKTWLITQYGPRDVNSMFYTLYGGKGQLIVVDGGWTEDADFVRQTIKEMGGKVDAWILTHPHQDHIGAFNAIYSDLQGLEIKEVYTVDMPSPKLCQERAHWDSVDTYNDFLDLNVKNLKYVYPGDELNICGLKVDIYNAYDEHVKELSQDYLNDGSMMFKVQGEKSSMLFCADVGKAMSNYLLDTWGEKLKADYIQMGHHGNGGLLKDFYEEVSPKLAFFDAPDWLMYDETGKYTTPENAKEMESLGSEVVSFHTQPNTVSIE